MRRSLTGIVCTSLIVLACSAEPAARGGGPGAASAASAGGASNVETNMADGSAGLGGSAMGASGMAERDGGGSGSLGAPEGAAVDAEAERHAAADCPPGGTGFTILGSAQEMARDNATCLTWDRSHAALGFEESKKHCQDLTLGGYEDWRMPTVEELFSLVRRNNSGNIDGTAFPNPPGSSWTATQPDAMHSCAVGFDSGGCYKYGSSAGTWGTYCVRGSATSLPPLSATCKTVCGI